METIIDVITLLLALFIANQAYLNRNELLWLNENRKYLRLRIILISEDEDNMNKPLFPEQAIRGRKHEVINTTVKLIYPITPTPGMRIRNWELDAFGGWGEDYALITQVYIDKYCLEAQGIKRVVHDDFDNCVKYYKDLGWY